MTPAPRPTLQPFPVHDPAAAARLGARWRALEDEAGASFFQSWTWMGTCLADRFPQARLLEWRDGSGGDRALALFNRRRRAGIATLWLHETGRHDWDRLVMEHNGIVAAPDIADALTWRTLMGPPLLGRRIVLGGIDRATLERARRAGGRLTEIACEPAHYADLAAMRARGATYMDSLSQNARAQIRRSNRRYAERGPLRLDVARTLEEAYEFLALLRELHEQGWARRGKAGAFANPAFARFHHDLIATGFPRGEIQLCRVTAGDAAIGYLYNFRHRRRVLSYQSGFAYENGDSALKPGLTCHAMAVEAAMHDGAECYDFLAGQDRYKSSLSNATTWLAWAELTPSLSLASLIGRNGRLAHLMRRRRPGTAPPP